MNVRPLAKPLAATLVAVGLTAGAAAPAATQSNAAGEENQPVKTDWSESQLDAFAAASVAINDTQAKWQRRINQAEADKERSDLREQANAAVIESIENEGLSVQEYNRIYEAAQQDNQLYEELMARVQDERGK